jgi:hypothetical protein
MVPPYTTSLDACAEFERTLEGNDLSEYVYELTNGDLDNFYTVSSDPLKRCEAFLKAKGIWK